jgi:hypothetical protein
MAWLKCVCAAQQAESSCDQGCQVPGGCTHDD